jgi:hypothetical protein
MDAQPLRIPAFRFARCDGRRAHRFSGWQLPSVTIRYVVGIANGFIAMAIGYRLPVIGGSKN